MPKKDIDYSKTIIYKIVCNDLNIKDCYVGSTTHFVNRKNSHKSGCINPNSKKYNLTVYKFIRENGGWDNWDMVLIESYPCLTHLEALKRERHWIEQLNASLNQYIPSHTIKEWNGKNKDKIQNRYKKWYDNNKEYYQKRYQEDKLIKGEELRQKCRDYKERNKDKLSVKCNCECGSIYRHSNKSKHIKSKKHIDFIEKSNI